MNPPLQIIEEILKLTSFISERIGEVKTYYQNNPLHGEENKTEYYNVLSKSDKTGTSTPFI
ncbi:MAG: hypothetical protein HRT66_08640 [Flavobacteriaceae bacterium]|nr:hypothetical protein [Flavobacteriaceae bacterium]